MPTIGFRGGVSAAILCSTMVTFGMAQVETSARSHAARYLDSIRQQPPLLLAFVRQMPKGGDLHNHLWGAIYAESFIDFAVQDGLCVDRTTSVLIAPPCDRCEKYTNKPAVACTYGDHVLYNQIVDAWSMRNWNPGEESAHDHFFSTFDKFSLAAYNHAGDMIAEEAGRAASNHLEYLELMHTADGEQALELGAKTGWDDNLSALREKLLTSGLRQIVASTRQKLDQDEVRMRSNLKCGTREEDRGCRVTVRYLYQVLRGLPRESVFAQMLTGFELAQADPRFVGLNLVMPEDWYVPMRDFDLHMRMLDYFHEVYPRVHISLHAGELALGLVPPERLRSHIRESVERGHAERIGHGVDIMYETDALELVREMARRNVLVEICLTSNHLVLGIDGDDHPFPIYRRYGVPVTLASDDEGVSRSDMTLEYVRAIQTYHLSYDDLITLARQSLEHSFLPGASLWAATRPFRRVEACRADDPGRDPWSKKCQEFLDGNQRARLQWKLESEFANFEKKF